MTQSTQVLIVDDHPVVRHGLQQVINAHSDLRVIGALGELAGVADAIERLSPHVVILDLSLPDGDGVTALKSLSVRFPAVAFLVMTMHDQRVYADRCYKAGAKAFLPKNASPETLLSTLRAVAKGHDLSVNAATPPPGSTGNHTTGLRLSHDVATLSNRQLQVFRMIGEGLSTRDIAAQLAISVKTIEAHKEAIKQRIGAVGATDLLRLAMLWRESAN